LDRQDIAHAEDVGGAALHLAADLADRGRLVVGDLRRQRIGTRLQDFGANLRLPGHQPRLQLDIEPLHQRVLQQELLLALKGRVRPRSSRARKNFGEKLSVPATSISVTRPSTARSVTMPFSTFWSGIVVPELM
jgi:hypothetical protein